MSTMQVEIKWVHGATFEGISEGMHRVIMDGPKTVTVNWTRAGGLQGDFDGDGSVAFSDFLEFAGHFGTRQTQESFEARFDLDGSGAVDFGDFLIFAQNFGKTLE